MKSLMSILSKAMVAAGCIAAAAGSNQKEPVSTPEASQTLNCLIGNTFITDIFNPEPGEKRDKELKKIFIDYCAGGVILYNRFPDFNVREQLPDEKSAKELIASIKKSAGHKIFVSVDVEGGIKNRLNKFHPLPSQEEIGIKVLRGEWSLKDVYNHCNSVGIYLKDMGINMNLAPVVDVLGKDVKETLDATGKFGDKYFIGKYERSYGYDIELVSKIGAECVKGMQDAGVAAAPKHFPGLGSYLTSEDTHIDCSGITKSELDKIPFFYIMNESKPASVMNAHAKDYNYGKFASLSKKAVQEIRAVNPEQSIISDEFTISCMGMPYDKGYEPGRVENIVENAYQSLKAGHNLILLRNLGHADEIIRGFENRVKKGLAEGDITYKHLYQMRKINQKLLEKYEGRR